MDIRHFRSMASTLGLRQAASMYLNRAANTTVIDVTIPGVRTPLKCRPTASDRHALTQIFMERDCDVNLDARPRFIIDGGANVGYASVFLANKYPDARVVSVEPEAANCLLAHANCDAYPNIRIIEGGIWSTHKTLEISNPGTASWAFQLQESQSSGTTAVQAYTIGELLDDSGFEEIDLLKLDIEGAEIEVFSASDLSWVDRTRVMVIEVHGEEADRAVTKALAGRKFTQDRRGEKRIYRNERLLA